MKGREQKLSGLSSMSHKESVVPVPIENQGTEATLYMCNASTECFCLLSARLLHHGFDHIPFTRITSKIQGQIMARVHGIDMDTQEETPLIEDGESIEQDILSEMNASEADVKFFVRVNRVLGSAREGAKEPFLFEGDAATTLSGIHVRLLDDYGSGTYRVRILKNNRLWKRFDITVEKAAVRAEVSRAPDMSGGLEALARALSENAVRQNALLERLLNERNAPQISLPTAAPNIMEMFTQFSTVFANMRQTTPDATSLIEVFKLGLETSKEHGSERGEKGIFDLVSDALPLLTEIISQRGANQPPIPQPSQVPVPSRPQLAAVNTNPNPRPANVENEPLAKVRFWLKFLVEHAQKDSDPSLYADILIDNLPEAYLPQFLVPGIFEQLKTVAPEISPYKEWFEKVLAEMREAVQRLNEQGSENFAVTVPTAPNNPNSGRTGGDNRNAENNAGPR